MPISLPAGADLPTLQASAATPGSIESEHEVLVNPLREASVRFELLDQHGTVQGELYGVKDGSVTLTSSASIKAAGSMTVTDLDDTWLRSKAVNWLNARIRPVMTIKGIARDIPMGVYLPTVPGEAWEDRTRTWTVELHDKGAILDEDVWSNSFGDPRTYVARKGVNILDAVRDIIRRTMPEQVGNVPSDDVTFPRDMVWDIGTTRLRIINDMLAVAGYFSLWFDFEGNVRVEPYVDPYDRAPHYVATGAFTDGETSMMGTSLGIERDLYGVPNRFVAVGQGTETKPALVAKAVITDPLSPFSVHARGRWITQTATGVEAADQNALNRYAQGRLSQLTSRRANFTLDHAFMPELRQNSVIQLVNSRAGIDTRASISSLTLPFDPTALCSATLREVTAVGTDTEAEEMGTEEGTTP